MYNGLVHAHSGLRWIVLLTLLYALFQAWKGWKNKAAFAGAYKSAGTFFIASLHVQFILGLIIYFQSPWFNLLKQNGGAVMGDKLTRFYAVEHISIMLLAVILATVGSARSKRAATDEAKHRTRFTFFLITLVLILAGIPWPFRFANAGWF